MQDENVLNLFQGLTMEQARELRKRMLPALYELRRQIVDTDASAQPRYPPFRESENAERVGRMSNSSHQNNTQIQNPSNS